MLGNDLIQFVVFQPSKILAERGIALLHVGKARIGVRDDQRSGNLARQALQRVPDLLDLLFQMGFNPPVSKIVRASGTFVACGFSPNRISSTLA